MTTTGAVPFPHGPDDFDTDWIEGVFKAPAGSLRSLGHAPVGTGQICVRFRFSCDWAGGENTLGLPQSFIAKGPSTDARSRAAAAIFHL